MTDVGMREIINAIIKDDGLIGILSEESERENRRTAENLANLYSNGSAAARTSILAALMRAELTGLLLASQGDLSGPHVPEEGRDYVVRNGVKVPIDKPHPDWVRDHKRPNT